MKLTTSSSYPSEPLQSYLYNRQYLITEYVPDAFSNWSCTRINTRWLCMTNNLSVTSAQSTRGSVVAIGELLDSENPLASNREIVDKLLTVLLSGATETGFQNLELAMSALGGRWIIVADLEEDVRLYPDTFGTRSTVYATDGDGRNYAASQPHLIADICNWSRSAESGGMKANGGISWPGALTPYEEIRRMLPNFYLDLNRGNVQRFWPRGTSSDHYSPANTARLMNENKKRLLRAAASRWRVKIGLTSGYDSRLTMACAADESLKNIEPFTAVRRKMPEHELDIARRVARICRMQHQTESPELVSDLKPIYRVMKQNCSGMGSVNHAAVLFGACIAPGEMLLLSHGTVGYKGGRLVSFIPNDDPEQIRASFVSTARHYYGDGSELAIREFDRWLTTLPESSWVDRRDLYSWEFRLGCWLPTKYIVLDTFVDMMTTGNCRNYQAMGVALPPSFKSPSYTLLLTMFEQLNPELLKIPFNAPYAG